VVFTESTKAAGSTKTSVFGTPTLSKIYVSLWKNSSTGYERVDGAALAFSEGFTDTTYGPQDAVKFGSAYDNLYIADKGEALSIDGRLPAKASDSIAFRISYPSTKLYQLKIDASNYIDEGFSPVLYDKYTKTTTAIGVLDSLGFTIDTAITATYANRFIILFIPSPLAVNSIFASAVLNDKVATITWSPVGEKGESYYQVEKSTDGINFTSIDKQTAKNTASASYMTTDKNVATGNNYYRIKAVSEVGTVSYSNVAKLTYNISLTTYSLYPNPLKGRALNVQLSNVAAGKYVVSIYNALGQKVNEQSINHAGGSGSYALIINSALAGGIYSVAIRDEASKQQVCHTRLSVQP